MCNGCRFIEGDLIQIQGDHFDDEDYISCECIVGFHNIEKYKHVDELCRRSQIFDDHILKQFNRIIEYQPIFRDQVFMVVTNLYHGIDVSNDLEALRESYTYSTTSYIFQRVYQRLDDGMLVMSCTLDELGIIL